MDFLKSLMLYMTLTMAATVQGADAPENVPMPTPYVPQTIVEELAQTAAPGETAAPDVTIMPSVQVTIAPPAVATPEPAPTLTPNPRYKLLRYGSRGDDVKKLQQRLSELGYLKGNIDGAYGYQTKNAVIKFQNVNGLKADGDAGKETLTHLYEDPNVIPNPETITPSPVPTATPDPDGNIPEMEDPRSIWLGKDRAKVLVDGNELHLIRRDGGNIMQTNPRVWQRGGELIVSLSDLAEACESWRLDGVTAEIGSLSLDGYTVLATMTDAAQAKRKDPEAYCQQYAMIVNGQPVEIRTGDWMFDHGEWFVTTGFLENVLNADVIWDADENTLMIRVLPAELAASVD